MSSRPLLAEGEHSTGVFCYDFRAFLHKGGALLSPVKSRDDLARRRAGPLHVGRLQLVKALHAAFTDRKVSGAAQYTLGGLIVSIRQFWQFCDRENIRFRGLDTATIRRAIRAFATELVQKFRSGKIQERNAGATAWNTVGLLADALDLEARELVGRTTMPRVNPGLQARAHDKLDLAVVDEFSRDLASLVGSLEGERIYGGYPIPLALSGGKIIRYWGHGPTPIGEKLTFKGWDKARIAAHRNFDKSYQRRIPLLQIRVQAEFLRFVECTGMNLAQALELTLGSVQYQSYSGEFEATGFKDRAGHDVSFRITKQYRPAFDRYLAFRLNAFKGQAATALFPFVGKGGKESKHIATRGFQTLRRIFVKAGKPFLPPSLLRYAKAQRLIRLIATGGNIAAVASALQNTVDIVMRSYLTGSQQMAVAEFTKFLRTVAERSANHPVRAGGDCGAPGHPVAIPCHAKGVPKPDCINPAGCLFCRHYRGVRSKGYLQKILSYRSFLRLRARFPSSSTELVDEVIAPTISRINDYVESVAQASPELRAAAIAVSASIENGEYHPAWRGWIELLELQEDDRVHA